MFCFEHWGFFNEKRDGGCVQFSGERSERKQQRALQQYARFNDFQIRNSAWGWLIDGLAVGGMKEGGQEIIIIKNRTRVNTRGKNT